MRISLNGMVSSDEDVEVYRYFGYDAFSPQTVRQALADNPAGEELVLEINSPGGSVMAGSEIYSVLRSAGNIPIRAEVQSLAASAASYLMLGCGQVWMSPVAQVMIHLPTTYTEGDETAHRAGMQMLETIRESILNAYELKAGGRTSRAEFRRLMEANTWMTAQEAVERGLADGILYQEEPIPQNVVNAVGGGIRALGASGGMPNIAQLRMQFQRQKQAQTGGVPGADNWGEQAKARLALEKIRFIGGSYT